MKYNLTYLGPSGRFIDPTTGLSWEVGDTHEVSEEDAKRLNPEYVEYEEHQYGRRFIAPDPSKARWEMEEVNTQIPKYEPKHFTINDDNSKEDVTPDPAVAEFGGND